MTVTINIPSQLPALTGNANLFLRVNAGENGIEWAATAGGGITIGTTAIASGTVGRVLFEGAGNVVQQSSDFFWDNTNGRLGIRVATPTASLEVLGAAASGTDQAFAVHNSTSNNNALIVTNDGRVGIGTSAPATRLNINGNAISNSISNNQLRFSNSGTDYNDIATAIGQNNGMLLVGGTSDYRAPNIFIRSTNSMSSGGVGICAGINVYNTIVQGSVWNNPFRFSAFSVMNTNGALHYGLTMMNNSNAVNNFNTISFWHLRSTNTAVNRVAEIASAQIVNTAAFDGVLNFSTANGGVIAERARLTNLGNLLIGTTTDVASSILTLESTTKGFLPPRMTGAQAEAIATPAEGLMVYATNAGAGDITAKGWWGYDGTNWVQLN